MLALNEGEMRIVRMERELAKLQTEAIPNQIAANLMRDSLKQTLGTAAVLANAAKKVIEEVSVDLDESVLMLASDLTGGTSDDDRRGRDR